MHQVQLPPLFCLSFFLSFFQLVPIET
uniref:Uncharacterized protein n=1 Tax=Rhizophora mucronata TaxID=61149 RepID=A0A2P2MB78_RHIMU